MMTVTGWEMMITMCAAAMPMNATEDVSAEAARWKAAWARGVQHLRPVAPSRRIVDLRLLPVELAYPEIEEEMVLDQPLLADR